jgi:hypothetical protein
VKTIKVSLHGVYHFDANVSNLFSSLSTVSTFCAFISFADTLNLQNNIHLDIDPEICTRNAVLSGRGALVELGVNCDKCPCRRNIDMCNENKCYR